MLMQSLAALPTLSRQDRPGWSERVLALALQP